MSILKGHSLLFLTVPPGIVLCSTTIADVASRARESIQDLFLLVRAEKGKASMTYKRVLFFVALIVCLGFPIPPPVVC
jgi:hypothetical protein